MTVPEFHQRIHVDTDRCLGCFACALACPEGLIGWEDGERTRRFHAPALCSGDCTRCRDACPVDAIHLEPMKEPAPAAEPLCWSLSLALCRMCRKPFTTQPILALLTRTLHHTVGLSQGECHWALCCPACRRDLESRRLLDAARWNR
ncbi:4Fe-4S dicluster domain-containing protein [Desulfacinum hydrothermale DSM 13146]|uniref:4Fe-4S dicluster domain-containing protein n=1 Tax=Desulfacinum hydrothermale DSM 13146 TaxID=1121390 RepID=A0A1W1XBU4_9BACT|nr:4Fe-4S dicluster domain-containing protein [Desulfacinum hydrothermale]SMC21515.1 4Fe-4S dicluster domain-containing protein [Desulfacinum hydrothermale DSM 13146]